MSDSFDVNKYGRVISKTRPVVLVDLDGKIPNIFKELPLSSFTGNPINRTVTTEAGETLTYVRSNLLCFVLQSQPSDK